MVKTGLYRARYNPVKVICYGLADLLDPYIVLVQIVFYEEREV